MTRNENKVLILLSTYNGERYLEAQLESLMNQEYPVDVLIRDDGSTDRTINIIEKYSKKFDTISFFKGNNVGFVKSFNILIMNPKVDEYKWIAFCDQDDIWLPNKISTAIEMLNQTLDNIPLLYFSNLTVTDKELMPLRKYHPRKIHIKKGCVFMRNYGMGCTQVFNSFAVKYYRMGINNSMKAHDWQMQNVCLMMGKIIYDNDSHILYRQHGYNTVGVKPTKPIYKGIIDTSKDLFNKRESQRVKWAKQFLHVYRTFMTLTDIKMYEKFICIHKIRNRIWILLNPSFSCDCFPTTIAFKGRVLVNRLY